MIINDRVMVPMTGIFESLAATVSWNPATFEITVSRGSNTVVMQIDNRRATVNGVVTELDAPPLMLGARAFIPVRFVSEALGAAVEWSAATRTVSVARSGFLPRASMTATATSSHAGNEPARAIDGASNTFWHTRYGADRTYLPQSITLSFDNSYDVSGFWYTPRQDNNNNGNILSYIVEVSSDGTNFTEVASGDWANTKSEKIVRFDEIAARHIRLTATDGVGNFAAAAEIRIQLAVE